MGDFNCPDWPTLSGTSDLSSRLCDFIFRHNLSQVVKVPTHDKGGILDLFITNSPQIIDTLTVFTDSYLYSDHFLLKMTLTLPNQFFTKKATRTVLNYAKSDFDGMCSFLESYNFSECYSSSDVERIWSIIRSAIYEGISLFTPTTKICSHSQPRWFTCDTRHRINCLNTLRRKHRRSPTPSSERKILDLEHKLLNHIQEAKLSNLVSNSSPNDIGNITRYLNSCSSSRQLPSVISMESVTASDDSVKANIFNQFFFSVFSSHSMTNQSQMRSPPEACIDRVNILPAEVYKALAQYKPLKSMGIDQIGPVILKHCASALFLPLHHLFCQSLIHGVLPQE